jgi:hypothetical protein
MFEKREKILTTWGRLNDENPASAVQETKKQPRIDCRMLLRQMGVNPSRDDGGPGNLRGRRHLVQKVGQEIERKHPEVLPRILLVEDSPTDILLIKEALAWERFKAMHGRIEFRELIGFRPIHDAFSRSRGRQAP